MLKSYGYFIAKDTPKLIQPLSTNERDIYDDWINGECKKYPAWMDYLEFRTARNFRHY